MIDLFCNDKAVPTKVSGEDASRFFVDLGHFLFIYDIYNVYLWYRTVYASSPVN
jgi:hypothetical protein